MRKAIIAVLLTALALTMIVPAMTTAADGWDGSISWSGQGMDSGPRSDLVGEGPRTEAGWIHWNVTQAGGVTSAQLELGGSGSGTYYVHAKHGNMLQFFTPYFDLGALTATVWYNGDLGKNPQFIISDWCDPIESERLTVTKTVVTSYIRTHFWDIDKSVSTENGYTHEGYPKIWLYVDGRGDETATWTVDVSYEGYEDSGFNVSGEITIKNTGTLDAEIVGIADELAGQEIDIRCPEELPFTLAVGETLTCTYSVDVEGKVEGSNVVTVTTERGSYEEKKDIVWGDPTTEFGKTVTVEDVSDLFGERELGKVTAPSGDTFTYTKDFAWADYGENRAGDYTYDNTAIIVETGQSASATLKVNVQGFIYETAYAKGSSAIPFIPTFANWGWTNPICSGTYTWDLWAGAAKCDTSKGTLVGSVTVTYPSDGCVTVDYNVSTPNILKETHVYAGYDIFPKVLSGKRWVYTVAPGQYYNDSPFNGSQVYVIAHAVVGIPDPNFGP